MTLKTSLLLALVSVKQVGSQALSVSASCLEFGPNVTGRAMVAPISMAVSSVIDSDEMVLFSHIAIGSTPSGGLKRHWFVNDDATLMPLSQGTEVT